jgi:hypothetical protein
MEDYLGSKIEVTSDLCRFQLEERLVDVVFSLEVNLSFNRRGICISFSATFWFDILIFVRGKFYFFVNQEDLMMSLFKDKF